jgi:hypothetical protein
MNINNLRHIVIPHSAFSDFSDRELYALNMVGHIFNETMALSKLTFISKGNLDQPQAVKHANMFQTIFFARLHAGKLHEARRAINDNEDIRNFLSKRCFPLMGEGKGKALLKNFNRMISECKWISDARNQDAMHFGLYEQLEPGVSEIKNNEIGFELIQSDFPANMLFLTSNVMTAVSFYYKGDSNDWLTGLEKLVNDIEQVHVALSHLIIASLDSLINSKRDDDIPEDERLKEGNIDPFATVSIDNFHIPFFFSDPDQT